MMDEITAFSGQYRFLSNFWPCVVQLDGLSFRSVESAYVAAKTTDPTIRKFVSELQKSGDAKKYGKTIELRADWEEVKLSVMENLLRQKFASGTELAKALLTTEDAKLIEGNTWGDAFWGVCGGYGKNHLGKLLMQIRDDLLVLFIEDQERALGLRMRKE